MNIEEKAKQKYNKLIINFLSQ